MTEYKQLCQELIWLSPKTNTYCMREKGHEGEHSIYSDPQPQKEKENANSVQVSDSRTA